MGEPRYFLSAGSWLYAGRSTPTAARLGSTAFSLWLTDIGCW